MATRGIVNPETTKKDNTKQQKSKKGEEVDPSVSTSSTGGKKRKLKSESEEGAGVAPPSKGKVPSGKRAKTAQPTEPKEQKPPRALLAMYKQVLAHPDYTGVIDKANPDIVTHLATRYSNKDGVEVFESSRKHNRLLRCVWKYLHMGKDPVQLEEAISLVTPKPAKAKKGGTVSLGSDALPSGHEDIEEEEDDEDEEED